MDPISEEIIDDSWHEVVNMSPQSAHEAITALTQSQQELFLFFMPYTEALIPELQELAVLVLFSINKFFTNAYGAEPGPVKFSDIEELFDENEKEMGNTANIDRSLIESFFEKKPSTQPNVIKFITDVLFVEEGGDDEDECDPEEKGLVFLLLRTVSDIFAGKSGKTVH